MSMIETLSDVNNSFLSRREIICNIRGLAGKLRNSEAVDMITKEFNLDGKTVIAINLKNQTGKINTLGTFYVYDEEDLAKKQINPIIFERMEKRKKKEDDKVSEDAKADAPTEDAKADAPTEDAKADAPTEDAKADAPTEDAKDTEKSE